MNRPKTIDRTALQRAQDTYRAKGRQIACVLRDDEAQAALAALEGQYGGVTAAVVAAVVAHAKSLRLIP